MTVEELILLEPSKVRRDSNLMLFYVETFNDVFGYRPNCAGCSFNSDWRKLVMKISGKEENSVTLQKRKTMEKYILKRPEGKILSYKKDGRTYRKYDTKINDQFAEEFLKHGTEEEIEQRKKMFSKFPKPETPKEEEKPAKKEKTKKTDK